MRECRHGLHAGRFLCLDESAGHKEGRGPANWSDPTVVETKNLKGFLFYDLDELHWKPKTKKADMYYTYDRSVTNEQWDERRKEMTIEIKELYIKAKKWWQDLMYPSRKKPLKEVERCQAILLKLS